MIYGSFPTDLELGLMEIDPFSPQTNRPPRDFSVEDGPVKCYARDLPRVPGMDVWWLVIAEEHKDRDPVEGTDPGHSVNISVPSDRLDKRPI